MESVKRNKIFVGGLSDEITVEDLTDHFKNYGKIINCQVMINTRTQKSKGYGFVSFLDENSAGKVLATTHSIKGIAVDCKLATSKKEQVKAIAKVHESGKKVFIENIPLNTNKSDFFHYFASLGNIHELTFMHKSKNASPTGFAFIHFEDENVSNHLIKLGKIKYKGHLLTMTRALSKNEVRSQRTTLSKMPTQSVYAPNEEEEEELVQQPYQLPQSHSQPQHDYHYQRDQQPLHLYKNRPYTSINLEYCPPDLPDPDPFPAPGNSPHHQPPPPPQLGDKHRERDIDVQHLQALKKNFAATNYRYNSSSNLNVQPTPYSSGDFFRPIQTSHNLNGPPYLDAVHYMHQQQHVDRGNRVSIESLLQFDEHKPRMYDPPIISTLQEIDEEYPQDWKDYN